MIDQVANWIIFAMSIAISGLWHFKEHPEIFLPLYLWMSYGVISAFVDNSEEQLAGWNKLKHASLAAIFTSLILPLIPLVWMFVFLLTIVFTCVSLFTRQGPFAFLRWRPFEVFEDKD